MLSFIEQIGQYSMEDDELYSDRQYNYEQKLSQMKFFFMCFNSGKSMEQFYFVVETKILQSEKILSILSYSCEYL